MRIDLSTQIFSHNWVAQNKNKLIQGLIIAGVILLSAVVALKASQTQLILLLGFLLGSGALFLLLSYPPLGLFLIPMVGMFVSFTGPGGVNGSILMVALLLGLWVLDMLVRQRKIQLVPSRTTLPILVFISISTLSLGLGQLLWYPFARNAPLDTQLGGYAILLLSAGAFLLVANRVRDLRWLQAIVWIFLIFGGIYVIARLHPVTGEIAYFTYHSGIAANSMFWVWLVSLSFSQAVFNNRLHIGWRAVLVGLALITLAIAFIQAGDWKSGWLPPLVSVAVIISFRYYRLLWVFVSIGLLYSGNLVRVFLANLASESYSVSTRSEAWQIVLNISKANPLLGMGFGNYYWYTPLFPILGYYVSFNSHNQYIDLIAQVGFLGLACFLWIFWEVGRLSMWLRERVPEGFAKAYVYGAIGGIVGTLVAAALADWVLPFVYNIGMQGFRGSVLAWIFLGGLVSIEQIVRGQANTEA